VTPKVCSIDDCSRPVHGRGWCKLHHQKWSRTGDPLGGRRYGPRDDPVARFWHYAGPHDDPDACWTWTGPTVDSCRERGRRTKHVYGELNIQVDGRQTKQRAHRFAYELLVGPIPPGLQLDHTCRNTLCVNPRHLEPVTNKVNTDRGEAAEVNRVRLLAMTVCGRGLHSLSGDNLGQDDRQRWCKACKADRARERRADARAYRALTLTLAPGR
jgi:hypothetical protein